MLLSNGERLFQYPLKEHIITAGWTYNDGTAHRALDFRATVGTPVYASEDGVIDWVQRWDGKTKTGNQSYGNLVRLKHSDYNGKALRTLYAHLSNIQVVQGQNVSEGQLLGYSGVTGNCYGAHLHYEVQCGGCGTKYRVNPLNWLTDEFVCKDSKVARNLGAYFSVEIPKEKEPEIKKVLHNISIMGVSDGDKNSIVNLCESLGLNFEVKDV